MTVMFGSPKARQLGMGYGELVTASANLFLLIQGLAAHGAVNGEVCVTAAIGGVIAIDTILVFFPIGKMLLAAFATDDGGYSVTGFCLKFIDGRI